MSNDIQNKFANKKQGIEYLIMISHNEIRKSGNSAKYREKQECPAGSNNKQQCATFEHEFAFKDPLKDAFKDPLKDKRNEFNQFTKISRNGKDKNMSNISGMVGTPFHEKVKY